MLFVRPNDVMKYPPLIKRIRLCVSLSVESGKIIHEVKPMARQIRYRCRNCGATAIRSEIQGSPPERPGSCSKKNDDGSGYKAHDWERIGYV